MVGLYSLYQHLPDLDREDLGRQAGELIPPGTDGLSDYDLFGDFTAGSYVMAKDFIAKNPNTTAKFVEATARAIEWTRATPREQVVERFREIVKRRARNEDDSSLQYWLSTGIAGKGGVMSDKEFQIWINWLVQDGQLEPGQLRVHDLFTNQFNPIRAEATF